MDQNGQWYQHILILFAIFYESDRYRRDYLSDSVCMFYVDEMCMFCIVFKLCVKFELVKSPEVTLSC